MLVETRPNADITLKGGKNTAFVITSFSEHEKRPAKIRMRSILHERRKLVIPSIFQHLFKGHVA